MFFNRSKSKISFSHYGEDMILNYVFGEQKTGFYIDVGCYHPEWFSNTKKLYDRGWKGINIDPNNDSIFLFNKHRRRDINLNYAISEEEGVGEYFKFLPIDAAGGGSGNSLSEDVKREYQRQGLIAKTEKVKTKTLSDIIQTYGKSNELDFLNIDVEGYDLQVLKSNDWTKHRPKIIAIEIWSKNINFDQLKDNETYNFLRQCGYSAFSVKIHTWFFVDQSKCIKST